MQSREFEKRYYRKNSNESTESLIPSPVPLEERTEYVREEQSYSHAPEPQPPPPPYSAFSVNRRRFILGTVTAAGFFGPLCGAIYLPSLSLFSDIFGVSQTTINATVSVYMVVFAVAPLFGAAASDMGGRKTVYMVGLGSFQIANILLATLPAKIGLLFILRIFQAFGSCIVFSVGAGTVADITEPKSRGSALAIFLMGPQLGPILGPLIGGQFAHPNRWRWVFGFLALTSAPVYFAICFCMPETLRSLVGNGAHLAHQPWFTIPRFRTKPMEDLDGKKFPKPPRPSLRKFIQLLKYPPHLIVSVNGALQFAGLYGMYISFPRVWSDGYNFSNAEVGYTYLVPGITMFIASIIVGRGSDYLRQKAIANSPDGKVSPERRITVQIPGFIIGALGKLLFGWFCHTKVHAAAGLFGSALAALGTSIIFVTSTSYQTECDPAQTASLVALAGLLRNVAAAIASAIMDGIIDGMGLGGTFTGLAIVDLLCVPGIVLIMMKGPKFREMLK